MVRYRCDRSQLRESAACTRDNVPLSARIHVQAGTESGPVLRRRNGTTSHTSVEDRAEPVRWAELAMRLAQISNARYVSSWRPSGSQCDADLSVYPGLGFLKPVSSQFT